MQAQETIQFGDWKIEVQRKAFRRSVSIMLYPNKPIKVLASKSTSTRVILDFLLKKKDWIEKNLQKFEEHAQKFPEPKIRSYEEFPFLGQKKTLRVVITLNKKPFVSVTEQELLLHIPRNDWSAQSILEEHPYALKEIREFYKREGEKHILARTQFWAEQMQLFPSQVKFRDQKSRWGSCNSRKVINFNWKLMVFAPEMIDYVIVHELAHLQHMDHSARFWGLVESVLPDFKNHVRALKESQALADFLVLK